MTINPHKCVACGNCTYVCPMGAIYVDPEIRRATINRDECVECYACYNGLSQEHLNPKLVRTMRRVFQALRLRFDPEQLLPGDPLDFRAVAEPAGNCRHRTVVIPGQDLPVADARLRRLTHSLLPCQDPVERCAWFFPSNPVDILCLSITPVLRHTIPTLLSTGRMTHDGQSLHSFLQAAR